MKKNIQFLLLFLIALPLSSQTTINNYKYIVVKNQFSFSKKNDQHQTSSLVKFLFTKNGYTAFLSNENFPSDLSENKCLALYVDVNKKTNLFTTKMVIVLRDCKNQVIFTSSEGKSRDKDYRKSYHQALKAAFGSIKTVNYSYQPRKKELHKASKVIIKKAIVTEGKKILVPHKKVSALYVQPIKNGFQLVNDKPAVVFHILKTNMQDVYIIKNKNGILYKNNKVWIAEFYENKTLVIKKYQIKF